MFDRLQEGDIAMLKLCHSRGFSMGLILAFAAIPTPLLAFAGINVVPAFAANQEGDVFTSAPFSTGSIPVPSMRYQQVFEAQEFASWGGGPKQITQIAFRPSGIEGYGGAFVTTLANVRIDLSTTAKPANGLSSQFAANVGADDIIAFSGPLSLSSAWEGPPGGPKHFDIYIDLTTPFTYDPSRGNLLLDVRNFGNETTTYFNGVVAAVDGLSRQWSSDVNSATAQFSDNAGLVTRFTYVPEPGGAAICLTLSCSLLRRKERVRTKGTFRRVRVAFVGGFFMPPVGGSPTVGPIDR
jgi:hypothetical protein